MPPILTPEALAVLRVVAPRVTIPALATAVVEALSTGRAVISPTIHRRLWQLPANGPDFAAWWAISSASWHLPQAEVTRYLKAMLDRFNNPTQRP